MEDWKRSKEAGIVDSLGFPVTETNVLQMEQYLHAYIIFINRNEIYGDMWKDYGFMDSLFHIRSKAMRLVRKFWRDDGDIDTDLLDDVYDLINYAVFFVRNFKAGNKWGRS